MKSKTATGKKSIRSRQGDDIRKQVFLLLHRPSGFEYFYHLFVVLLIITSCCVLNILKPKNPWDDIYIYNHYRTIHMAMCGVDSFLSVFLFAEMLTRFWSAEHNALYCGFFGKCRYIADHPYLSMDLFAFLTFFGYVVFNFTTYTDSVPVKQLMEAEWWVNLDSAFRIAHAVQVLHTYRVIYKLVRPIFSTIYQQANQLLLAIFVVVIIMILCSVMVFLCNLSTTKTASSSGIHHHHSNADHHRPATDFAAAIWHCFVAFSTVGYDTHLPYSRESLAVLAACALVGVWSFMLPSIILGNGLSITVSEQRRMTFRYVSIAEMIRIAIAHHKTSRDNHHHYKTSKKKPQKERQLRLVTDHLHSLTKLDILRQPPNDLDRLLKINYDGFDIDEHSLAEDDEALWNKLLTIPDDQQAIPVAQAKYAAPFPGPPPSHFLNESLRTQMTFTSTADRKQQQPKSSGTPQSGSTRVLDNFENMDLSKYSNDNSMLWYNLGLIEDSMDEMTDIVCNHLVRRVDQIKRLNDRLVLSLAALKRERSTEDSSSR